MLRDKHGKFASGKKAKTPTTPKVGMTYVTIVLDESGSMAAFGSVLENLKLVVSGFAQSCIPVLMRILRFNYTVSNAGGWFTPAIDWRPNFQYSPTGGTALYKAVYEAGLVGIHTLNPEDAALVLVITDGEENSSFETPASVLRAQIDRLQASGQYTLTFQVPKGNYGQRLSNALGVPIGNIREWELNNEGFRNAVHQVRLSTQSYATARTSGQTATNSFYTDLSQVTSTTLKNKLNDLSASFKPMTLDQESEIKKAVEFKTQVPYVIGCAYYQLMKPEKIQPNKGVLIVEKGKKKVWGGPEARALIGLPQGLDARVKPGNHANYDIYVQSTSTNRKLPRGTKILIDVTLTQSLTPTWSAPVP
jgi:hypothetical protein